MMAEDRKMADKKKSDHGEVWEAIDALRDSHVETQKEIAGFGSALKALADEVKHLSQVVSRPPEKTNWIGIGLLIFAAMGIAGGYMQARMSPSEKNITQLTEFQMTRLNNLPDDYYKFGYQQANIDTLKIMGADCQERIHHLEMASSASETDRKTLHQLIRDVDLMGSRKWVDGKEH